MAFDPEKSVEEFIEKFDANRDPNFWLSLMDEEGKELQEAYENLLKEAVDYMYVYAGFMIASRETGEAERKPDASIVTAAAQVESVIRLLGGNVFAEAFDRVHQSNMSKLDDDGKPIKREDGKVMKGPNYKPPVLSDLI